MCVCVFGCICVCIDFMSVCEGVGVLVLCAYSNALCYMIAVQSSVYTDM